MSRQSQRQGESSEHWADITNINQIHHSPKLPAGKKGLNEILEAKLPEIRSAGRGHLVNFLNHYSVINLMGPIDWQWSGIFLDWQCIMPKHTKLFTPVKLPRGHQLFFFFSW